MVDHKYGRMQLFHARAIRTHLDHVKLVVRVLLYPCAKLFGEEVDVLHKEGFLLLERAVGESRAEEATHAGVIGVLCNDEGSSSVRVPSMTIPGFVWGRIILAVTVYVFPCVGIGEADLVGRDADYWACNRENEVR